MTYTVNCAWLPVNNFLFQIANVFLLASYLCPPTLNGLLYLRFTLGFAGLFFALWGWLVLCAPDTALWNLFFFVGNMAHLVYILLSRRTKKFHDDMEKIYEKFFKPLSVPRYQFRILAETAKPEIIDMPRGETFVTDGETSCETLSIVLEGRMEIRKHGLLVHVVEEYQFINSPEWVLSQEEPYTFEVTIQCRTQCRIVSWNRVTLLNLLKKNPYLKAVTDSVVSTDVAKKIFLMNKMIGTGTGQRSHSIYSLNRIGHLECDQPEACQSPVNAVEENDDIVINSETTGLLDGIGHLECDQPEACQSPVNAVKENYDIVINCETTRLLDDKFHNEMESKV